MTDTNRKARTNRRRRTFGIALLAGAGFVFMAGGRIDAGPAAGLVADGAQFLINSYAGRDQNSPKVGMARDGRFTVTWQSSAAPDGGGPLPLARSFDAQSGALGEDFEMAFDGVAAQLANDVAQERVDGHDVVLFAVEENVASGGEVFARAFVDGIGETVDPVLLSTPSDGARLAHVFVSEQTTGGDVIAGAVWEQRDDQSGSGSDVFFRRIEIATGTPVTSGNTPTAGLSLGSPMPVNTYVPGNQRKAVACVLGSGNVAVAWLSSGQVAQETVFGRIVAADGAAVTGEFQVSSASIGQSRADVCCSDSRFVVAWDNDPFGPSTDGDGSGIQARIYDDAGQPLASEFVVNSGTALDQYNPSVGCDRAGNFVVAWGVSNELVKQPGSYARAFDRDGTPYDDDYEIAQNVGAPAVALNENGGVLAAWSEATFLAGADRADIIGQTLLVEALAGPPCGDPIDPAAHTAGRSDHPRIITASDALFILSVAVGFSTCEECVCDVNGDGNVTATDALAVLNIAIGIDIALDCPAC